MSAPFEIIAAPFDAYVAPIGTAFPALDAAPSASWKLLGTSGNGNQTQAGVTVSNAQTAGEFMSAGSTMARKRWRQTEGLNVTLTLADMSVAMYSLTMDAAVTTVAPGTTQAGESHFEFYRGPQYVGYALLLRGISPFNEVYTAQYELPSVNQTGSPAPAFSLQAPAELALDYQAFLLNPGNICVFRAQSATHT